MKQFLPPTITLKCNGTNIITFKWVELLLVVLLVACSSCKKRTFDYFERDHQLIENIKKICNENRTDDGYNIILSQLFKEYRLEESTQVSPEAQSGWISRFWVLKAFEPERVFILRKCQSGDYEIQLKEATFSIHDNIFLVDNQGKEWEKKLLSFFYNSKRKSVDSSTAALFFSDENFDIIYSLSDMNLSVKNEQDSGVYYFQDGTVYLHESFYKGRYHSFLCIGPKDENIRKLNSSYYQKFNQILKFYYKCLDTRSGN